MKNKLLIVPGYLIGIGSLFIITIRTFLAFFNESKSVTINVNTFGEQYLDIVFLIILWVICIFGLKYLYNIIKKEDFEEALERIVEGKKVVGKDGSYLGVLRNLMVDEKTGAVLGALVEPAEEIDQNLYHLDSVGNIVVSYDSIKVIEDDNRS